MNDGGPNIQRKPCVFRWCLVMKMKKGIDLYYEDVERRGTVAMGQVDRGRENIGQGKGTWDRQFIRRWRRQEKMAEYENRRSEQVVTEQLREEKADANQVETTFDKMAKRPLLKDKRFGAEMVNLLEENRSEAQGVKRKSDDFVRHPLKAKGVEEGGLKGVEVGKHSQEEEKI